MTEKPKQSQFSKIPKWMMSYASFFAVLWAIFFLIRFVFLFVFRAGLTQQATQYLLKSFYIGAKFDARLAAFILIPFALFVFIKSFFKAKTPKLNKITASFYSVVLTSIALVYAGNFGHYAYVGLTINASVLKFLEDAFISFEMVWQTYPVVWATLGLALVFFLSYKFTTLFLKIADKQQKDGWKRKTLYGVATFVLTFGACYGQIDQYPLRWSNAYFSSSNFVSNLTLNPVLNLFDTFRFSKEDSYNIKAVKELYPIMANYLGVDKPDEETLNFERVRPGKNLGKNYNVIVIYMESLAWNKSSLANPELDATPFVKELAQDSALFTQFYTPTSATARAVFAGLSGIPDVSSFKTSSRNPLIVNQNLLANGLEDYSKYFFIGGSASWGNIRGIISHNIDGLKLYEEYDLKAPRTDVWGVNDLDLLKESAEILANDDKPFIAVIQTAGFHRPYTIPKENAGFKPAEVDLDVLKNASFGSQEEFNSLRFSDHVLREFFKIVKTKPYYKDTVFLIFGDHGLSAGRSENMPRGYVEYNLINHHVPLIVHAPALLKPQVIDRTASQVDIMPTAIALIGKPYKTRAMGRDLFDPAYYNKQGALVYTWGDYPPTVSFVNGDYLYYDKADKKGLYKFADLNYNINLKDKEPQKYEDMEKTAYAIYETSRYMLYNNPKEAKK